MGSTWTDATGASRTCASSPSFRAASEGQKARMESERVPEDAQNPALPTPAERRAFKLLPLVWVVVLVLAAIILYTVFS
jgi:hypothetical protein